MGTNQAKSPLTKENCKKFGWSYRRDPVGTRSLRVPVRFTVVDPQQRVPYHSMFSQRQRTPVSQRTRGGCPKLAYLQNKPKAAASAAESSQPGAFPSPRRPDWVGIQ